jgi:hypothetical protein
MRVLASIGDAWPPKADSFLVGILKYAKHMSMRIVRGVLGTGA